MGAARICGRIDKRRRYIRIASPLHTRQTAVGASGTVVATLAVCDIALARRTTYEGRRQGLAPVLVASNRPVRTFSPGPSRRPEK